LYDDDEKLTEELLIGIYNTVVMKDIIQKNSVRDSALLDSLIRFLAANVGNMVSTKKISDYLTSAGRKTTSETIDNYLRMVESSFIIYKVNRYDMKGKMHLKTLEKYYLVDSGLRYLLAGTRYIDEGHVLENIVFLELIRRDYNVSIGKIGELEVDFIASKAKEKIYVQVTLTMNDESIRRRELKPLLDINDNYPKYYYKG
jgi:predicted AAA+ superfamily ATPase